MVQTLQNGSYTNYNKPAKTTAEIMARYRPIAPKPQSPDQPEPSDKIRLSPYLRSVWPHLQSRPTRTRKRGRASLPPPPPPPPCCLRDRSNFPTATGAVLDLNNPPPTATDQPGGNSINAVISPQPVRLVGSSISISAIRGAPVEELTRISMKKAEEVEEELECDGLPAIVSDSKNKVRLVNSAYKEMVGQPICPWLDSVHAAACRRICGEVLLRFVDDPGGLIRSLDVFSCSARIEWGVDGKKTAITVFCETVRLFCESKDYMFKWRFHTRGSPV